MCAHFSTHSHICLRIYVEAHGWTHETSAGLTATKQHKWKLSSADGICPVSSFLYLPLTFPRGNKSVRNHAMHPCIHFLPGRWPAPMSPVLDWLYVLFVQPSITLFLYSLYANRLKSSAQNLSYNAISRSKLKIAAYKVWLLSLSRSPSLSLSFSAFWSGAQVVWHSPPSLTKHPLLGWAGPSKRRGGDEGL